MYQSIPSHLSVRMATFLMISLMIVTAVIAEDQLGPGTFDLSWNTVDGGGGTSSGGAFEVSGTAGQPDAGAMSGGTFALSGGFWPGTVPVPVSCNGDITGDGLVNVNDLLAVINGWGPCPLPCPPHCSPDVSPVGGDCQVNVNDLLVVINAWGVCP